MPNLRWAGFPAGSVVSVAAASGGVSRAASVPAWAGGSPASPIALSLSATRTTATAPAGVIFEATGSSPAAGIVSPYHDLHFTWDFSDAGAFGNIASDLPWGRGRNTAYGPVACHVFGTPGVYTVTCTARDGVNPPRSETVTITVADPDTVFAGDETAVISGSGNFAGKPAGASEFASFAAALTATQGKSRQRYLFRAGETFVNPHVVIGGAGEQLYVGRFGTGANPVFDNTGDTGVDFSGSSGRAETVVTGLDIRLPYAPENPAATAPEGLGVVLGNGARLSGFKTVSGVTIRGAKTGIHGFGTEADPLEHVYLGDISIRDWYDYGILLPDAGYVGLAGAEIAQNGDTINGSGKNAAPYWADHGPFRISRQAGPVCGNLCDLKSFNSWAGLSGDRSFQPTFRCNTGQLDQKINLDRVRSEGGPLTTHNATSGSTNRPMYALVDKAHIVLSDHPIYGLQLLRGGTTFRNVIAVVPDTAPGTSTGLRNMAWVGDPGGNADGNLDRRLEIYNCTFADLRSDGNARSRTGSQDRDYSQVGGGGFSDTFVGNNVDYAPNMATGGAQPAETLATAAKWAVTYGGERWEGAGPDLSRRYGSEVTADFRPGAAIPASGKTAIDDFYGVLRGSGASSGAVQP